MGIPDRVKQFVYGEADFQCSYCGHRQGVNLTIHHIIPVSEDGDDSYENLIVLCHNCQQNLHNNKGIKDKEIRRLKRHLVARYLTPAGVNALKLAHESKGGFVVAFPFLVQHLVDRGLLEFVELVEEYTTQPSNRPSPFSFSTTVVKALYKITGKGKKLTERWIISKKETIDN